jgi:hypothetical protein
MRSISLAVLVLVLMAPWSWLIRFNVAQPSALEEPSRWRPISRAHRRSQVLMGHKTLAMTLSYAHLAPVFQRDAITRLDTYIASTPSGHAVTAR